MCRTLSQVVEVALAKSWKNKDMIIMWVVMCVQNSRYMVKINLKRYMEQVSRKWNDAIRINLLIRLKSPKGTDLGGLLDVMELEDLDKPFYLESEDLNKPLKLLNFPVLSCDTK